MKEISVKAKNRTATGKKATKELRKQGYVPCNLYGLEKDENGKPAARGIAILATDLRKVIYTPHVYVVNLDIEGEHHPAVMKELQFHPTTDAVLHIDFLEVNEDKPLTIGVPVHLVGLAQGIRDGGRMNLSIRKIEVTAPYQQIPEQLDIDVTHLTIGKSIKVGQLSFEGLELATSKEVVVCSIKMTRAASKNAAAEAETEEAAAE
ncbi:MAG: 50S ribosomal protein L25 [Prevotella sp.]|nr:50S ribosomal protein L25 [Prevotella sp.]MBP5508511.1 50S ribosomal protein L25 [Prevotella sp.]